MISKQGIEQTRPELSTHDTALAALQTDLGDPSARTNLQTLIAMMGNPDAAGKSLYDNLGDFVGLTNFSTLLALLGVPDVSGKSLYAVLVTDLLSHGTHGLAQLRTDIAAIPTTMRGTDSAATVADGWDAALATILDNFNATRIGDLDELASGNMPADLDTVKGLVDTAEVDSSFSYLDAGGEQDVYEDAVTTRRKISFSMDINAMNQGGVVKVYLKVDGTNYRVWILENIDSTTSGGTEDVYTIEVVTNQNFKVSYTEDVDETAARAIPYSVVTQVLE